MYCDCDESIAGRCLESIVDEAVCDENNAVQSTQHSKLPYVAKHMNVMVSRTRRLIFEIHGCFWELGWLRSEIFGHLCSRHWTREAREVRISEIREY